MNLEGFTESVLKNEKHLKHLKENFPFLTFVEYNGQIFAGIVQNSDSQIVTMYVYNLMSDKEIKEKFLKFGNVWWWESSRKYPINVYFKDKFAIFSPYIRSFIKKKFNIIVGPPCLSIEKSATQKRQRRKQILFLPPNNNSSSDTLSKK